MSALATASRFQALETSDLEAEFSARKKTLLQHVSIDGKNAEIRTGQHADVCADDAMCTSLVGRLKKSQYESARLAGELEGAHASMSALTVIAALDTADLNYQASVERAREMAATF